VKGNNIPFAIKYLKTCSVLLQQAVARHPKQNPRIVGSVAVALTRAGLPRMIPHLQRVLIRKGQPEVIRLWLSLFNINRYLESVHDLSKATSTIIAPGVG